MIASELIGDGCGLMGAVRHLRRTPVILFLLAVVTGDPAHALCNSDADCPFGKVCSNSFCVSVSAPPCSACTYSTSCSTVCQAGSQLSTCEQAGTCAFPPCSQRCFSSSNCNTRCQLDAFYPTCGAFGVCDEYINSFQSCPTGRVDRCELASCSAPSWAEDRDGDGLLDRLEYNLAHKFFPAVWLQTIPKDVAEAYPANRRALPYTAEPFSRPGLCGESFKCIELRMPQSYFYDHGGLFGAGSHLGDSEFYAALVLRTTSWSTAATNADSWVLIRDFTAAHWGTPGDSSRVGAYGYCPTACSQFSAYTSQCASQPQCFVGGVCTSGSWPPAPDCTSALTPNQCSSAGCLWEPFCADRSTCYSTSPLSGPATLYAAESKHALYHTQTECDLGNWTLDSCSWNVYPLRSSVGGFLMNVGRSTSHLNFDTWIQHPDRCTLYSVWSGNRFGDSTPLREQLRYYFDWPLP